VLSTESESGSANALSLSDDPLGYSFDTLKNDSVEDAYESISSSLELELGLEL
jgi:hypothetical protein